MGVNTGLYRLLRGAGLQRKILLLTTVGAKSGQGRTVPLLWFPDGQDAWLVMASAGGAAKHPAWYRNLATNPNNVWIEVGARRLRVRPELLKGSERERRWQQIVSTAANFGAIRRRLTASHR